jgi:hypothetical protein
MEFFPGIFFDFSIFSHTHPFLRFPFIKDSGYWEMNGKTYKKSN